MQEVAILERDCHRIERLGLTLAEAKQILKALQQRLVEQQTSAFVAARSQCASCGVSLRSKGQPTRPFRTLFEVLNSQGMQMNQPMTFLSDGEDTVRELPLYLNPQTEHILDWFHISMRLTVLDQYAKGLVQYNQALGEEIQEKLERLKWSLWHGNLYKALYKIEDIEALIYNFEDTFPKFKQLEKAMQEFRTYLEKYGRLIPNYGERWRYGEAIATGFVESTVNAVLSKRFCKRQQMQWTKRGAHLLLQTRVKTLNHELGTVFQRWYPDLQVEELNYLRQSQGLIG